MSGLADWTNEELAGELKRRAGKPRQEEYRPIPQCDECAHFIFWTEKRACPSDYNACALGHAMRFKLPEDGPNDLDWGFYRRKCRDRTPSTNSPDVMEIDRG